MKPLGLKLERTEWEMMHEVRRDVIGDLEMTGAGNLLLRVGRELEPASGNGWAQIGHVVLDAEEVGILCDELAARFPTMRTE